MEYLSKQKRQGTFYVEQSALSKFAFEEPVSSLLSVLFTSSEEWVGPTSYVG